MPGVWAAPSARAQPSPTALKPYRCWEPGRPFSQSASPAAHRPFILGRGPLTAWRVVGGCVAVRSIQGRSPFIAVTMGKALAAMHLFLGITEPTQERELVGVQFVGKNFSWNSVLIIHQRAHAQWGEPLQMSLFWEGPQQQVQSYH